MEEPVGAFRLKDHNGIHASQRGDHGGALVFRHEWAVRAFELTNRLVSIQSDNEEVAQTARVLKIADMAEMKEIETAVGGDNLQASPAGVGGPAGGLR